MAVVPMFPLGSVLLPGGVLPLHVFEPRYRQMVLDCVEREEHDFGVVLIARGNEVGGGEERRAVGTMARMVQVAETEDGRFAVVAVGTQRIRVRAWLPDDPYPVADVDDWSDTAPDDPMVEELVDELLPRIRRAAAMALELGDGVSDPQQQVSDDPLIASYHLAALAPLSVVDRYDLLCAPGPLDRLQLLRERMDDVEALLELRLGGS